MRRLVIDAHVADVRLAEFMAAELVQLGIGRIVGVHAQDELVLLPLPQIITFGIGIRAVIAVHRLGLAVTVVGDHVVGELGNHAAIQRPLLFRLVTSCASDSRRHGPRHHSAFAKREGVRRSNECHRAT